MSGESSKTLSKLLDVIACESFPEDLSLERIIVVASAPSIPTINLLRRFASADERVMLIHEAYRSGKIEAVNRIIENGIGSYLIFVNADAVPEPGALSKLLSKLRSDPSAGSVSACPTFIPSGDLTSWVLEFMWNIHNVSSLRLNHLGLSNHASDELMAVRSEALVQLPDDVINDGAYISGHAFGRGYRVLFVGSAKVGIDVPMTVFQLVEQRRRILFGHSRVWKRLGKPPLTIESLIVRNPMLSISLLVSTITSRPRRLLVVPVAVVIESVATILSIKDGLSASDRHRVWRRYRG